MQATTIGLDIAKNVFQVHGVDARGKVVLRKRLARARVLRCFANLPPCLIGLEACGGAHYWARELTGLGHEVRLMPPQYVKAYVKSNKHDAADAEACCEAVQRPSMRFVAVKTQEQQALLMLHRVRDQLIGQRTATTNALRGHLTELGIVAAQCQAGVRPLLAMLGEVEDRLPPRAREMLQTLAAHLRDLEAIADDFARRLVALTRTDPVCRALSEVPGVGPGDRHRLRRHVPDAAAFRSGRHLSAWLGLVRPAQQRRQEPAARPQQTRRRLSPPPADSRRPRLVWRSPGRTAGRLWAWIHGLLARRPFNVVVAAVANKLARILWTMLRHGEAYRAAV